jgi:hypothetical protein
MSNRIANTVDEIERSSGMSIDPHHIVDAEPVGIDSLRTSDGTGAFDHLLGEVDADHVYSIAHETTHPGAGTAGDIESETTGTSALLAEKDQPVLTRPEQLIVVRSECGVETLATQAR